nr:hypothetical protein [Roseomonas harenae]
MDTLNFTPTPTPLLMKLAGVRHIQAMRVRLYPVAADRRNDSIAGHVVSLAPALASAVPPPVVMTPLTG